MNSGIHIIQILAFQTFIVSFILIFKKNILKERVNKNIISANIIRAAFWLMATYLFFTSQNYITLPSAVALSFSTPLFTIILAIIILKETMKYYHKLALLLGFTGMLLIVQPGGSAFNFESLIVILACFLWSITDIIVKRTGAVSNGASVTFYFALFSFIMLTPFLYRVWITPTIEQLFCLLAIAIFFLLNMLSLTHSYKIGNLTIIQPFAFMSLIFTSILAYFTFNQVITLPTIFGSIIIIASSGFITYREHLNYKKSLSYIIGDKTL
jgi:drug/metabolite transporter (DMT)-like permease